VSFAIPIDIAMEVVGQLRATGKVQRGRIGVQVQDLTADLARSFGLNDVNGALVSIVEDGGPAAKAGLTAGDVILAVDGKPVTTSADMARMVATSRPGARMALRVWRAGANLTLSVTVAEQAIERPALAAPPEHGGTLASPAGLQLRELTAQQRARAGIGAGVLVSGASGPAVRAGILPGDLILALNHKPVRNVSECMARLVAGRGSTLAVLIKRGDASLFVPLRLE
jgi:serine protease Do